MNDFARFFVGYDKVAAKLSEIAEQSVKLAQNYPPFNVRKIDENKYAIEMALAGFGINDIDIELHEGKLIIKSTTQYENSKEDSMFLYKGISSKPFVRQFTLADNIEIEDAELINGILRICLESVIPESFKPTKIKIKGGKDE
jgi:molecular chaperone IbpA